MKLYNKKIKRMKKSANMVLIVSRIVSALYMALALPLAGLLLAYRCVFHALEPNRPQKLSLE